MSAADPVSAPLFCHLFFSQCCLSRTVATAEATPAVKHRLTWHTGARPGPLIGDSLASRSSNQLTWDDWELFGCQFNPLLRAQLRPHTKSAIKLSNRHLAVPWLIVGVVPVSWSKGQTSLVPGSQIPPEQKEESPSTATQAEHVMTKTAPLYFCISSQKVEDEDD